MLNPLQICWGTSRIHTPRIPKPTYTPTYSPNIAPIITPIINSFHARPTPCHSLTAFSASEASLSIAPSTLQALAPFAMPATLLGRPTLVHNAYVCVRAQVIPPKRGDQMILKSIAHFVGARSCHLSSIYRRGVQDETGCGRFCRTLRDKRDSASCRRVPRC